MKPGLGCLFRLILGVVVLALVAGAVTAVVLVVNA